MEISFFLVFLGGLSTFLTPCILPILPTYLSYISGVALEEVEEKKSQIIKATVLFILGFSLAFSILQIIVVYFANFGVKLLGTDWLFRVFGVLTMLMALHLLNIVPIKLLMYQKRFEGNGKKLGSFLLGFFFGFGWTPCMGPIIFSVMAYISTAETLFLGILYLLVFLLGFAMPMLIFSIFLEKLKGKLKFLIKYTIVIERVAGGLLFIMGLLLFFNKLDIFLY